MHIYIDEAGNFVIPTTRNNYVSCVVALIIPSAKRQHLFDWYLQLRTSWGSKAKEIKGSAMTEQQIAKVISILGKYEVIAEVFAIDGTAQSEEAITKFRRGQADRLTEHLGPEHHPDMVASMKGFQEQLRTTPNQLFAQIFLSTLLCEEVIRIGTLYWSQRVPQELGQFSWIIDAKDRSITQTEDMWRTLLMPFLETRGASRPLGLVNHPNFDYSYLEKLAADPNDPKWQSHYAWMKEVHDMPEDKPVEAMDMRGLFGDMTFANSEDEVGLQLADVVASAFHRACKGTLQKQRWKDLGSLFILRREAVVHLVALAPDRKQGDQLDVTVPQLRDVLLTIRRGARSMSAKAL
jgi:hypothetical protein